MNDEPVNHDTPQTDADPNCPKPVPAEPNSPIATQERGVKVPEEVSIVMPTVGRIVLYRPRNPNHPFLPGYSTPADGSALDASSHNYAEVVPAVIVRVWSPSCVNLKVFADGPATPWHTSVNFGDQPGQWSWPTRS